MSVILVPRFSSISKRLRTYFEKIQSDINHSDRFAWDWWHLPGRYTHLRTPAEKYFSAALNKKLEEELIRFGKEHLGCQSISPIWLSNYIEGCEQKLHADRPHGPWAFVLPLTPKEKMYSGGETVLLKPEILSYWEQSFSREKNFEFSEIFQTFDAQFNRLIVFDPRIPHGVSEVKGTTDPLKGRLVLHGWFTQPRPFVDGPVTLKGPQGVESALLAFDSVLARSATLFESTGTIAFRISISAAGRVTSVKSLASSLISSQKETPTKDSSVLTELVQTHFKSWNFPANKKHSRLFLPLSFEVQ